MPGAPVPAAAVAAPGMPPPAGGPGGGDICVRDEQITFAPAEPRVNNEMLIAVTSSRSHPYGRLTGTEKTTFVRERPGQLGWVGEWTVQLSYPGKHTYTFSVDSTIPCKSLDITVRQALSTRTPTPLPTPTLWGDNGNGNGNGNNNSNDNTTTTIAPFRDLTVYSNTTANQVDCVFFQSQGEAQRTLRASVNAGFGDPNLIDMEDGVADGISCSTANYNWAYPDDRDFNPVAIVPTMTPTLAAALTRADRVPGLACSQFANGRDAHEFLRANPTDPLYMDHDRNGIACGGTDGPTIGGVNMPQPFWQPPTVSTALYPPNPPNPRSP